MELYKSGDLSAFVNISEDITIKDIDKLLNSSLVEIRNEGDSIIYTHKQTSEKVGFHAYDGLYCPTYYTEGGLIGVSYGGSCMSSAKTCAVLRSAIKELNKQNQLTLF